MYLVGSDRYTRPRLGRVCPIRSYLHAPLCRSHNLAQIATRHEPQSVIVADILDLPHPLHSFDFAISIAVVHHLSTPERRREAVVSILQTLKVGGRALIYVWALEQESSRRGWTEHDEQDVMVPWVMRGSKKAAADGTQTAASDKTFHRFYHLSVSYTHLTLPTIYSV